MNRKHKIVQGHFSWKYPKPKDESFQQKFELKESKAHVLQNEQKDEEKNCEKNPIKSYAHKSFTKADTFWCKHFDVWHSVA